MVEGARLESVFGSKAQREFESRPVRHFPDNTFRLLTPALGFCLLHRHFLPYLVIPDFFLLSFPRKRGAKATPTGGPEQSERVSAAHNPKCRDPQDYKDFSFLALRVKPEDDNSTHALFKST